MDILSKINIVIHKECPHPYGASSFGATSNVGERNSSSLSNTLKSFSKGYDKLLVYLYWSTSCFYVDDSSAKDAEAVVCT